VAGCSGRSGDIAPGLHAQRPDVDQGAPPDGYYAGSYLPGPVPLWLDVVLASQAAQPNWMTPLVTVTPRLEQEFRYDQYDQKTGLVVKEASVLSTTADLATRVELIPSYDWEVILAPPPTPPPPALRAPRQVWRLAGVLVTVLPTATQKRRLYRDGLLPDDGCAGRRGKI
jgi:hypothetical protein